jgi:hypothetical protein
MMPSKDVPERVGTRSNANGVIQEFPALALVVARTFSDCSDIF